MPKVEGRYKVSLDPVERRTVPTRAAPRTPGTGDFPFSL